MNERPATVRTEIGRVIATVMAGRSAAIARRVAIQTDVDRRASAAVTPDVIRRVGGKKLERFVERRDELRQQVLAFELAMAKWKWLTKLPFGSRLFDARFAPRHDALVGKLDEADVAATSLEGRIANLIARKARLAAISMHREEVEALSRAIDRTDAIKDRLQELVRQGVTHLAIEPAAQSGSGWYRRLTEMLAERPAKGSGQEVASPIADGCDHSHLNLSPRSRVIAAPYSGPPKEQQPWLAMAPDRRPFLAEPNRLPGGLAGYRLLGSTYPSDLYGLRRRSGIPRLPGSLMKEDRLYLPVGLADVGAVTAAGAVMGARNAFHIDPGKVSIDGPIAPWLPFIAQRWFHPLPVELIPRSSWGSSLANLLTKTSWNEIRERVVAPYDGRCQICGELKNGHAIEVHEIWQYDEAARYGDMAVQRLVGLFSVCKPCHGVFHQGFSKMRGHGDQAEYRLADINGWSMDELERAEAKMATDYARRSKLQWALDLSLVMGKPLVVDRARWVDSGYGILTSAANNTSTAILGAAYRIGAKGEACLPVKPPLAA